jgi:hypothetical protein
MKPEAMVTYGQFLSARHLSEMLLMKHSQESSNAKLSIYSDIQVNDEFRRLAALLGFRVEKIEQPVEAPEAAE